MLKKQVEIARQSLRVIRNCLVTVLLFEGAFQAVKLFVIEPLAKLLLALAIRLSVGRALTNENFADFVTNPFSLGLVALVGILFAWLTVFEIAALVIAFDRSVRGKRTGIAALLLTTRVQTFRLLWPKNVWLLFLAFLIMPLTSLGTTSSLFGSLTLPTYIQETIDARPLLLGLFAALIAAATFTTLTYLLVFNVFFLDRKDAAASAKISRALMKGKRTTVFFTIFLLNLTLGALSVALPALILSLAQWCAKPFAANLWTLGIYLGAVGLLNTLLRFVFSVAAVWIVYAPIAVFYRRFQQSASYPLAEGGVDAPLRVRGLSDHGLAGRALAGRVRPRFVPIRLFTFVALTVIALLAAALAAALNGESIFQQRALLIFGHRGATDAIPGNTMPAFERAIREKADFAELDVQLSSDRVVMVTHDTNLKASTGLDRNIYDLTAAEAQKLDLGRGYDASFAGTRLPTLDEVIRRCKGKIKLNIEIKTNEKDRHIEPEVLAVIRANGFENDCVVTSLSAEVIARMKELAPEIRRGLILTVGAGTFYDSDDADFFSLESTFVTERVLSKCRERNKAVYAWTIDEVGEMKRMTRLGVDGVITGYPAEMRTVYDEQTAPAGRIRALVLE